MKKLLITLLTLFITLTFSNSTFALDWFFKSNQARCSIEYVEVDYNHGERIKYVTTQSDLAFNPDGGWIIADPCYKGSKKLATKMNKWMKKSTNNIILSIPRVNCKRKTEDFFTSSWSKYKECSELYRQLMIDKWLEYPHQWFKENNINNKKIMKNHPE
jgi:hypothetical protein